MKGRGVKYIILSGLWTHSVMLMGVPAVVLYSYTPNKPFLLWFCGIVYTVNYFTGLYFVMGFGERET